MSKKKKQATEELVQTQVLNIEEVRRVANYEKKLSKKPAAICAILGMFMILLGGASQGYISYNNYLIELSSTQKNVVAREDSESLEENIVKGNSTLDCILLKQNNPDGTNYAAVFTYNFTDSKLKTLKKELMMDGYNPAGLFVVGSQMGAYQSLSVIGSSVPGYIMATGDRAGIGFYNTTIQDLNILNPTMIPEIYNSNMYTSVEYKLDTKLNKVKTDNEARGFTCTLKQN